MLGVAGNSPEKDKYIDVILKLGEDVQSILMETMMKYIQKEEPPASSQNEVIDKLNSELQEKEEERVALAEKLKKTEQEKVDLGQTLEKLQKTHKDALADYDSIKQELEEYRKRSSVGEPSTVWIQKEKEMEAEIESLKQEVVESASKLEAAAAVRKEETEKLKEELFLSQQKIKKSGSTELQLEQQKKRCEELIASEQSLVEELKKIPALEQRIVGIEKEKKTIEEKNKSLINDLYAEKDLVRKAEGELKKSQEEGARADKEMKKSDEKCKAWEQKARQAEEQLSNLRKEYDTIKLSADAGNLLSQEKEANYQAEIGKLRAQVERLTAASGETPQTYVLKLEDKLKALEADKEKLTQEVLLINKRQTDIDKENEALKTQIEYFRKTNSNATEQAKEYQQLKQSHDELVAKVKEGQETLTKYEGEKQEGEKVRKERDQLRAELAKVRKERVEADEEGKKLKDVNLELEKRCARDEEKALLIQEERNKLEALLKDASKKSESVLVVMHERAL